MVAPSRLDMQNFTSIPFKTESAHGLTQVNGVAKISPAGIVLEYESKLFGVIRAGVKEVRIPLSEILDVKFRKGLFKRGAKIEVRMRTFAKLAELPSTDGKLTLKIIRDDFERADAAVKQIQQDLNVHEDSLSPPRTPVSQLFEPETDEETKQLDK